MKKLREKIEALGYDFKKEILIFCIGIAGFLVGFALIYIFSQRIIFALISLLFLIVFAYFYLTKYDRALRKIEEKEEEEFIHLFSYFGIFVNNGFNVYNSLEKIKEFASSEVKKKIEGLLKEIDEDKTVTPFVNFSKYFSSIQIKEVMIAIYQMIDEGEGGTYIRQYEHIFSKLRDEKHHQYRETKLNKVKNMGMFPLLGSGVIMFGLIMLISQITEVSVNGL
ncbi:MAG: hypothetical protein SPL00_04620 [Bacilli bacterium]|nr:hypothetical protein [Bacilli bacterium]